MKKESILKFTLLLALVFILNGIILISLYQDHAEALEHRQTQNHVFGTLQNETMNSKEKLYWSTQAINGDSIQISWTADGLVTIYVFSSTQFANYINGSTCYPEYSAKSAQGTEQLPIVNNDTYYVVVDNQASSPYKVKVYDVQNTLATTTITTENVTHRDYPYFDTGMVLIVIALFRVAVFLKSRQ